MKREWGRDNHNLGGAVPNSEKVNLNLDGKCVSESATLVPPKLIVTCVHLVSKWYLLLIVRWKESDLWGARVVSDGTQCNPRVYLSEHPSESTSGIRATGETEDTYLVSVLIYSTSDLSDLVPRNGRFYVQFCMRNSYPARGGVSLIQGDKGPFHAPWV